MYILYCSLSPHPANPKVICSAINQLYPLCTLGTRAMTNTTTNHFLGFQILSLSTTLFLEKDLRTYNCTTNSVWHSTFHFLVPGCWATADQIPISLRYVVRNTYNVYCLLKWATKCLLSQGMEGNRLYDHTLLAARCKELSDISASLYSCRYSKNYIYGLLDFFGICVGVGSDCGMKCRPSVCHEPLVCTALDSLIYYVSARTMELPYVRTYIRILYIFSQFLVPTAHCTPHTAPRTLHTHPAHCIPHTAPCC